MSQLRRRPGSIVGRSDDVRAVRAALERSAVVTLLGPGGVGKTALAAELMNEVEPDFDQVVAVELAEARDEGDVVRLLAAALGVAGTAALGVGGTADLDRVTTELAAVGTMVLVVLDNCEQVVDEVARVVGALLDIGPSISVLATSRRPLEVGDEVTWPVRPLPLPPPLPDDPVLLPGSAGGESNDRALTGSGAVQLFLERVRQAVPSFELTPSNREPVARICAAADGLPLTLELAAALVRSRPLDEILVALNQRPADLAVGRRDRPEHQRSIGASLDWSRRFLDPDDARLLDRLSIFVGGFTSEAARHVDSAGTADGLARLVDHSLIDFDREAGRYRILEVVRLDAERRLTGDERAELRRSHLQFCLTVVAAVDEARSEPDPDIRFPRFEHELGNLGAAARWALADGDVDGFRALVGPIAVWWVHYLAPDDPERWERLFVADAAANVPSGWQANVVSALGFHWSHRGEHRRSIEYGRRAVELHAAVDDHDAQTLDEVSIGNAFLALGHRDEARAAYDRGAVAAARSGQPYSKLAVLVSQVRLDPESRETPARLAEARSLAEVGFGAIEAAVVVETGLLRLRTGDRDGARRLVDEGLAMAEANGYAEVVAAALSARAELAEADGEIDRAVRLHRRALALGRRQMHRGVIDRAEAELSRLVEVDRLGAARGLAADGGLGSPAGPDDRSDHELSERELSVARLLRGDLTQREIADELYIAPSTVKTHIKSIYRKLDVSKRSHAVTRAGELGLFDER